MATEATIISEIESKVNHYVSWSICITDDPQRYSKQHHATAIAHNWDAVTESVARRIEGYFLGKGMLGARRDGRSPHFVCIYI